MLDEVLQEDQDSRAGLGRRWAPQTQGCTADVGTLGVWVEMETRETGCWKAVQMLGRDTNPRESGRYRHAGQVAGCRCTGRGQITVTLRSTDWRAVDRSQCWGWVQGSLGDWVAVAVQGQAGEGLQIADWGDVAQLFAGSWARLAVNNQPAGCVCIQQGA